MGNTTGYFRQNSSWNQYYYSDSTAGGSDRISIEIAKPQEGEISPDGNKVWVNNKWINVWKDNVIKSYGSSSDTYTINDDRINKIIDVLGEMAKELENANVCQGIRKKVNILKESITYWPGFPVENNYNEQVKEFEWYLPEKEKKEKIELEKELFEI